MCVEGGEVLRQSVPAQRIRTFFFGLVAAMMLAFAWGAFAAGAASAHAGHGGHDHNGGRLPGQPDFKRIGDTTYRFNANREEYEIRTPGQPKSVAHVDYLTEEARYLGAAVYLPTPELAPTCRTSGNRIVVVYSHRPADTTPTPTESLRSIVRRMNWKINQQGSVSSGGGRTVKMAVDCNGSGLIQVYNVATANNNLSTVSAAAKAQIVGDPTGTNAVKYLVFDHEENEAAAGVGDLVRDEEKSWVNGNATKTGVALVYNGSWDTHVSIHELFHNLGAVQATAPYANTSHCVDGIDILCYEDGYSSGGSYSETRCPAGAGYQEPEKTPLDCGYDTYFNTAPGSGNWLATHWDTGGEEDPFLLSPTDLLLVARTDPASTVERQAAALNGVVFSRSGLETTYRFDYGTTTSYGSKTTSTNVEAAPTGTKVATSLTGLSPNTTYHYRLLATNSRGTVYGADQTFQTSAWALLETPSSSDDRHLRDVSCTARSSCTAVGYSKEAQPLAERWDGAEWVAQTNPTAGSRALLQSVSCTGPSSCMAVGFETVAGLERPLAQRWNGTAWSTVTFPNPAGAGGTAELSGVSCSSATACVAVGSYVFDLEKEDSRALIGTWDGSKWTLQSSPVPEKATQRYELHDVSCPASNACTAVGRSDGSATTSMLVEQWDGSAWTLQTSLGGSDFGYLKDISCSSAAYCLATGISTVPVARAWNGSSWEDVSPAKGSIPGGWESVSCPAPGNCVVIGFNLTAISWNGSSWSLGSLVPPTENGKETVGISCPTTTYCMAVGSYFSSGRRIALAEQRNPYVPPAVSTEAATPVTGSSATLRATVNPEGNASGYLFQYGLTSSYGSAVPASSKAIGSSVNDIAVSEAITGLKPLTTYHYRVVASSVAGQGLGKDLTFTTPADTPAISVEAPSAVSVTKATLNASLNPNGAETTYQFEYGKTTAYGTKVPVAAKAAGSGLSALKVSEALSGLSGGATYHYRLVASNSIGTTNSADATFTTQQTQTRVYSLSFGKSGNANGQFGYPRGVAVDPSGNVYVTDLMHGYVQKFNSKGEYLSKITIAGSSAIGYMQGLAVDSKGNLWISDNEDHSVTKYSSKGEWLMEIESAYPTADIAVDSKDGIWIAEPQGHQVDHYNSAGEILTSLGGTGAGSGAGKFNEPSFLALDAEDNLWVAERGNKRVQKFSSAGTYLSGFGSAGTTDGKFQDTSGIDVGPDGTIWVSDMETNRIQAFSPAGAFLAKFGAGGTGPGQFGEYHLPSSNLALAPDGSVWVVDPSNQRVQKWVASE